MKTLKTYSCLIVLSVFFNLGCSTSPIISTPVEKIDRIPLKITDLTEDEKQTWGHKDLTIDTIPGISLDKAYSFLKGKRSTRVLVAVIDSGVDIKHEDLDGVIWRNQDEIANNGRDDDKNGYIDDIHGWNFLGETTHENFELTRILRAGDTNNPDFTRAQQERAADLEKYTGFKTQYEQILQQVKAADERVATHLKKKNYTKDELYTIETEDEQLKQSVGILKQILGQVDTVEEAKTELSDGIEYFSNQLNYYLNTDFKGRKTQDDVNDLSDTGYGDNKVSGPVLEDADHGTHVSGIIAAEWYNKKGVQGVARNVKIMPVRAVPNGDEYDKDIALAIRYAVDNGAQIINASFGKNYTTHPQWVKDAVKYASDNNVLFVHAAGNKSANIDLSKNYPSDELSNGQELGNTFLSIGAITSKYGSDLVASYSNYGKKNVDVFAPGDDIYSTIPDNKYDYNGGTSMAAPAVSGVAAMLMSYYPKLTAAQVKKIIMQSGVTLETQVVVPGGDFSAGAFNTLSKSGKILNAYNAVLLASKVASGSHQL